MSEIKKFSIKKLLLTILCSIIFTTFIGNTYLFISVIPNWIRGEGTGVILQENPTLFNDVGEKLEKQINEMIAEEKAEKGENFPALGAFMYLMLLIYPSVPIVKMYIFTLVAGLILGTIIYIVLIQKAKGKKLILELLIAFISIFLLITLANKGYELLINYMLSNNTASEFTYLTSLYDMDNYGILLPFIAIFGITYICNLIYQKIQTNKLNKELNKNN